MKIGMILLTRFPPDIRVEKEALTLAKEHEVFLLCSKRKGQKAEDTWNNLKIRRVLSTPERWWSNWRLMSACRSGIWEKKIRAYIEDYKLDALHVHDLPLLDAASKAAKKKRIPIVADFHENYPQMLAQEKKVPIYKQLRPVQLLMRLSVSIDKWTAYEKKTAPLADKFITVIEEARNRLIIEGFPPGKIHVVANYVDSHFMDEDEPQLSEKKRPRKFRIVYAGGFGSSRDLATVVEAAALIPKAEMPDLEVVLVGGKGAELADLQKRVLQKDLGDRVVIHKWLPLEEMKKIIADSHVGLVPHAKTPHTDSTIPHKIFQYMSLRLPVIVSNCAPLQRIVSETNSGLVYQSGNSASFADCLRKIYADAVGREKMGEAGFNAVKTKFNWDMAGEELLKIYRDLVT